MRVIRALYKGVCPLPCKVDKKGEIKPGQDIVKMPAGPYRHAKCAGVPEQLKLELK